MRLMMMTWMKQARNPAEGTEVCGCAASKIPV